MQEYMFIDEVALLRAFIEHKSLSYTEVQEKGIVPALDKQERRALFKNTIDKFKSWEVIESVPDSHPKTWTVVLDRATVEYDKLKKAVEQKQLVEKYSLEDLTAEVRTHSRKLTGSKIYKVLAISGFSIAVFQFVTGMSLIDLYTGLKHIYHLIVHH